MLSSASCFQTTASGISQDTRSYDNNMSSNTTSSSFVSDDEVRYFKQTKASFTRQRSEHNPQKWRCVPTFYFAFRRASLGGNLHAHGDAKVCEI